MNEQEYKKAMDDIDKRAKEHGDKIRYQNLLHVTLKYNKYSIKEFFDILEKEDIDIDPDSLVDGSDSTFDNDFDRELVKEAKEKLYPYREQAKNEPDIVNAADQPKYQVPKLDIGEKVGDFLFTLYDAPRRMMCGMPPFDLSSSEEEVNEEEEKKDENVEVVDKDGKVIETDTKKTEEKKVIKQFPPVKGVVNNDIQKSFNKIFGYIKDRVSKGTTINVIYNNITGLFDVDVKLTNGETNTFKVDAETYLPDYYSVLIKNDEYGTIAIPFAEEKLTTNIVNYPKYKITEKELDNVFKKYYFDDIGIYYVFDFSTFKGLNKMGKKNKKKFETVLTKLCEDLKDKDTEDVPRFRISRYVSPDDFTIISDYKVKSPLADIEETSAWIANTELNVNNGEATVVDNTVVQQQKVA